MQDEKVAKLRNELDMFLKIMETRGKIKLSPDHRKSLLNDLTKVVMKNPGFKNNSFDKKFLDQLKVSAMLGMTDPKKFQNLMKDLMKILKDNKLDLDQLLKMKPKELQRFLEKKLSPQSQKELSALLKNLSQLVKEHTNKYKMALSPDQKNAVQDPYQNLLGLINSAFTGGIAFPVLVYHGNGQGIVDRNANDGMAPIDSANKIYHQNGEAAELSATVLANYKTISGIAMADEIENISEKTAEVTKKVQPSSPFSMNPLSTKNEPK